MTVSDVMLYGQIYAWAKTQAYHEMPVRCVPCGCGAEEDQLCIFRNGRGKVPHADRRVALMKWKKANLEEYEAYQQELIAHWVGVGVAIAEMKRG